MKKLVLETTAPFQGLPELVADREGLFEKEGLQIEWVERESDDKSTHVNVNTPGRGSTRSPATARCSEQVQGRHVQRLRMGQLLPRPGHMGRQPPGRRRRGIVTYAAIVVRPDLQVFTGQQLAGRHGRRAVLLRHALSGAASARGASCRARTSSSAARRTVRVSASMR